MKFMLVEGVRRLLQMFFGMTIFELPVLRSLRLLAYRLVFDIEKSPTFISNHVTFFRGHHYVGELDSGKKAGVIKIGQHVSIAADVEIDYCGRVEMGKYVWISEGVKIFTHTHELMPERIYYEPHTMKPVERQIGDYAWLGANVIVLPSVREIGKNAIIGSGSIVTKDVPENAVVAGNPAKVIRYLREDEVVNEE